MKFNLYQVTHKTDLDVTNYLFRTPLDKFSTDDVIKALGIDYNGPDDQFDYPNDESIEVTFIESSDTIPDNTAITLFNESWKKE